MGEWLAFFFFHQGLMAAAVFGYFFIANSRENARHEVLGFGGAVLTGFLAGLLIAIVVGPGNLTRIMAFTVFGSTLATTLAAAPRLIYLNLTRASGVSLGFLFRLAAYSAVLLCLARLDTDDSYRIAIGVLILTVAFYGVLLVHHFAQSPQRWLLLLPLLHIANLLFVYGVNQDSVQLMELFNLPRNWPRDMAQSATGLLLAHIVLDRMYLPFIRYQEAIWNETKRSNESTPPYSSPAGPFSDRD